MPLLNKDGLPSEAVEYIEELEKSLGDAADLIEKLTAEEIEDEDVSKDDDNETVDDGEFDISKATPEVAAYISKMQGDLEAAQADISKERQIREVGEMVSKAAAFNHLTITPAELGGILYAINKVDPELTTKVESILKAANEQVESADIFKEIGSTGASTTVASSAESAAQELMKSEPGLTFEGALARAYETNPALYAEHVKGA